MTDTKHLNGNGSYLTKDATFIETPPAAPRTLAQVDCGIRIPSVSSLFSLPRVHHWIPCCLHVLIYKKVPRNQQSSATCRRSRLRIMVQHGHGGPAAGRTNMDWKKARVGREGHHFHCRPNGSSHFNIPLDCYVQIQSPSKG